MDAKRINRLFSLLFPRTEPAREKPPADTLPGYALEPRIMLDAAMASTGEEVLSEPENQQGSDQHSDNSTSSNQSDVTKLAEALEAASQHQHTITEVVLIDPSVPDYQTLMAGISGQAQVHILSSSASLAEIAEVLSGYQNLDAVHIISHGSTGLLALSGETVDADTLASQQETLAAIGQSLNQEGDILLYGCNVGSDREGQAFIEQLAELTGADIAASDDITGAGGDWILEANSNSIETQIYGESTYQYSLNINGTTVQIGRGDPAEYRQSSIVHGGVDDTVEDHISAPGHSVVEFNINSVDYSSGAIITNSRLHQHDFQVDPNNPNQATLTITYSAPTTLFVFNNALNFQFSGGDFGSIESFTADANNSITSNATEITTSNTSTAITIIMPRDDIGTTRYVAGPNDITEGYYVQSLKFHITSTSNSAPVNTAPTISGQPSDVTVTEDTASNLDLSTTTFVDNDAGDTLTVTLAASAGTMTAASSADVTIGGPGSGSLTLSGTAANINSYLDNVSNIQYTGAQNVNGDNAATLTISASDGDASLISNPTVNIDITAVNDAPVVDTGGYETDFVAGSSTGVLVVDSTFSITDIDDANMESAVITLSGNGDGASETLSIDGTPATGITVTYTSNTRIDLSGSATKAHYENLIKQIKYNNSVAAASATAGDRTITITANDGEGDSSAEASTVAVVIAPLVDTGPGTTYVENDGNTPVRVVGASATITDSDSTHLNGMVINITNDATGDRISLAARSNSDSVNGITITYNNDNQITLSGNAIKANYLTLLKELQFENNSQNPDTTTRNISIATTDSDGHTGTVSTTVTVQGVNDAPVAVNDTGSVNEDQTLTVNQADGVLGDDTDVDNSSLTVTAIRTGSESGSGSAGTVTTALIGTYGTLTINANGSYTYIADQDAANALPAGQTATDTFTYTVSDGSDSDTGELVITVNGQNDASVISGDIAGSVIEGNDGDAAVTATGNLSISDADSGQTPVFADQASTLGSNSYGSFVLTAGTWTYTLNQSAVQSLGDGETVTDTITYTASDNNSQVITVTINGTNDNPTVTAALVSDANEGDSSYSLDLLGGAADVDTGDVLSVTGLTYTVGGSATGNSGADLPAGITFSGNSLTIDPTHSSFESLAVGDSRTIVVSYTVNDDDNGSVAQTATITIDGTNDNPTVTTALASDADEGDSSYNLDLLGGAADVDTGDVLSVTGLTYTVDGTATDNSGADLPAGIMFSGSSLTIEPTHSSFESLAVGDSRTIVVSYTVNDDENGSVAQTATITIDGTNDNPTVTAALVSGADEGDSSYNLNLLGGAADVDTGDVLSVTSLTYTVDGSATVNSGTDLPNGIVFSGNSLTIDPNHSSFENLGVGDSRTIVVSYTVNDDEGGSVAQTTTITIDGTNDVPAIQVVDVTGAITEGTTLNDSGSITFTDLDLTDRPTATEATSSVTSPDITLTTAQRTAIENAFTITNVAMNTNDGTVNWDYTIADSDLDFLGEGETVKAVYTITVTDDENAITTQDVTITITGANDEAVVDGVHTGTVKEGDAGDPAEIATGTLSISDIDQDDSPVFLSSESTAGENGYGHFSLADEAWSYVLNQDSVQHLEEGEQVTDHITYTASDGTSKTITVNILGTSEAPAVIPEPDKTVNRVVLDIARPEPGIPDPLNNSTDLFSFGSDGMAAESPSAQSSAGVGDPSGRLVHETDLITHTKLRTDTYSVQTLFSHQEALNSRYGSHLTTKTSSSGVYIDSQQHDYSAEINNIDFINPSDDSSEGEGVDKKRVDEKRFDESNSTIESNDVTDGSDTLKSEKSDSKSAGEFNQLSGFNEQLVSARERPMSDLMALEVALKNSQ